MLAANVAIPSLLLCLLIARNSVRCSSNQPAQIVKPEVSVAPLSPDSPEVLASASPREPRIVEKTTVLRREKPRDAKTSNTTVLRKKTALIDGDDGTTTNFPGPMSPESSSSSSSSSSTSTMDFRPSVHIGEIHDYESRKSSASPFNNVQHVKFENSVTIDDRDAGRAPPIAPASADFHDDEGAAQVAGRKRNHRVKFYDTDSRYGSVGVPIEYYYVPQQQQQQQTPLQQPHHMDEMVVQEEDTGNNNNNENNDHVHPMPMPMGHEGLVTFEYPMSHYAEVTARPVTLGRPVYPASMTDPQMHLPHYEPGVNNVRAIYVKPTKFHDEVATPMPVRIQHYEYLAPVVGGETPGKPEVLGHHQPAYQVVPQHADTVAVAKPDTVLVLSSHRETAYTRMRKFPYKFYLPEPVHHAQEHDYYYVPDGPAHGYPAKMRASPWKKIIHLIGAFLPLGLLLAALKPNIVQLDTQNTTNPNIVLSKLRDLPAEHKRGRIENGSEDVRQNPTCEDKSICELIVSGSEPNANLLQNILWNLTNRSTDEEAKKHGLHEIFAAVKQKDCSTIDC